MISSVVESCWNWNFADFKDFVLILPEAATGGVLKNFAIFSGKHLCQSLFLTCHFIEKEALVFLWILQPVFTELVWMTASTLQRLPALYFAIIYSWQLSSSESRHKSVKNYFIYHKDFTDFFTHFFFIFFYNCLITLLAHELILFFGLRWVVRIGSFFPKLRYFTD